MKAAPRRALAVLLLIAIARSSPGAEPPAPALNDLPHALILDLRIGPALGVWQIDDQLALGLDAGVALDRSRRLRLVLGMQLQIERGLTVLAIPVGLEYDAAVPAVPWLWLCPRLAIGYSAFIPSEGVTAHTGVAAAELEVRFAIGRRFHVGLVPLSVPLYFDRNGYSVSYRILVGLGVGFL